MTDQPIFATINALASEEEQLWERAFEGGGLASGDQQRLKAIKVELDQCFDLLHKRDARRSAGLDPDAAAVRPVEVVERCQQ